MAGNRRAVLLVLGLVAVSSTGCGSSGSDAAPTSTEATSTEASATPTTGAPSPAPDAVVWQVQTDGTASPIGPPVPDLTIYGDGRVFVADDVRGATRLRVGTVDPDDLAELLDDAEASDLFTPGTDFGDPGLARLDRLEVAAWVQGERRGVTVLAPGIEDTELRPAGRLTDDEMARRGQLDDLDVRARALASGLTEWTPDRVRAVAGIPGPGEELTDPELVSELLPLPWPGPPFDSFPVPAAGRGPSCLVIDGADAGAVFDAAQENTDGYWTEGDDLWPIVVTPLLPGHEGCPPD